MLFPSSQPYGAGKCGGSVGRRAGRYARCVDGVLQGSGRGIARKSQKAKMVHSACRFELCGVVKNARFFNIRNIVVTVNTVQKAEIRIVGAELFKLPFKNRAYGTEVSRPAVFAFGVIYRPEVQLKNHVAAAHFIL